MRLSGVNHLGNFGANFNKANNNTLSNKKLNNSGYNALNFTGINRQYEIKKHIPESIKSAVCDIQSINRTIAALTKDMQRVDKLKESIQTQGKYAYKDGQFLLNETMDSFIKGNKTTPDGTVLRKITQNGETKIMEEYDESGSLVKVAKLNNQGLKVQDGIKKLDDGTLKIAREVTLEHTYTGKLIQYKEGIEESLDGSYKAAREMYYNLGRLNYYRENFEKHPDGKIKTRREMNLIHDKSYNCTEGKEILSNGTKNVEATYSRNNNIQFCTKEHTTANGSIKTEKELYLENEEPSLYIEDNKRFADGSQKAAKKVCLHNGKPEKYEEDYEQFSNGLWKSTKKIYLEDGKPIHFINGSKNRQNSTN